jgi:hypothetical protein
MSTDREIRAEWPDPHGLRDANTPLATWAELREMASELGVSRSALNRFVNAVRVAYVDGRGEGGPGKLYSIPDVRARLPRFLQWHGRVRAANIARDQARQEAARAAKATKTPKPSKPPSPPPPSSPRPLPPILARGTRRGPAPEVIVVRRAGGARS